MSILQEAQEKVQRLEVDLVNNPLIYNERIRILNIKPEDVKTVDYSALTIHEVVGMDVQRFTTIYKQYIQDNLVNGNYFDDMNCSDFNTFTHIHREEDIFRLFTYIQGNLLFGYFNFKDNGELPSMNLTLETIYVYNPIKMLNIPDTPSVYLDAAQKVFDLAKTFFFEDYRRTNQINESLLNRIRVESMQNLRDN